MKLVSSGAVLAAFILSVTAEANERPVPGEGLSNHYSIDIDFDYHDASFTGRETVRFVNRGREEIESIFFSLYPNVGLSEEDSPWLSVRRVAQGSRELRFGLRSRNSILKVDLPQKLSPGQGIELTLEFSGRLPRIQREESSLLAHFLQEVNDAVSDERHQKDARDIFFASEEAILLGHFYPMLAVKQQQSIEQSTAIGVGAIVSSEVADYEVSLTIDEGLSVIASGSNLETKPVAAPTTSPMMSEDDTKKIRVQHRFRGENLRGFAIAIAEKMKSVTKQV